MTRAFSEPLLAMLYVGFLWVVAAFLLYGTDSLLTGFGAGTTLVLAPLHALGIGFFGSLLLAMASRVSLGHSGRPLRADWLTQVLFWGVQGAALLRMLPDLAPDRTPYALMLGSAVVWLVCFGIWTWRFAPLYWRPRADGRPG